MSGLVSLNTNMVGELVTITGAANSGNNGTFTVVSVNELAGTITFLNFSAVAPDANNGSITWTINTPAAQILLPNAGARIETFVPLGFFVNAVGGLVSFAGNGGIALCGGSNDYPTYSTISGGAVVPSPRTFARCYPIIVNLIQTGWSVEPTGPTWMLGPGGAGAQIFMLQSLWNGATISSVSVSLVVSSTHSSLPTTYPVIRVERTPLGAGSTLGAQTLSTTANQSFPTPANLTAYLDGGLTQLLTYVCNQNNVVDSTQYLYYVQVTDETGGGAVSGNVYAGITVNYTSVTSMAPQ
jgi:hypothetical protein